MVGPGWSGIHKDLCWARLAYRLMHNLYKPPAELLVSVESGALQDPHCAASEFLARFVDGRDQADGWMFAAPGHVAGEPKSGLDCR